MMVFVADPDEGSRAVWSDWCWTMSPTYVRSITGERIVGPVLKRNLTYIYDLEGDTGWEMAGQTQFAKNRKEVFMYELRNGK